MTTIVLDVIAVAKEPEPEPEPTPAPPPEVVIIHVAPSPRRDPADLDKLEIVDDGDGVPLLQSRR